MSGAQRELLPHRAKGSWGVLLPAMRDGTPYPDLTSGMTGTAG